MKRRKYFFLGFLTKMSNLNEIMRKHQMNAYWVNIVQNNFKSGKVMKVKRKKYGNVPNWRNEKRQNIKMWCYFELDPFAIKNVSGTTSKTWMKFEVSPTVSKMFSWFWWWYHNYVGECPCLYSVNTKVPRNDSKSNQ